MSGERRELVVWFDCSKLDFPYLEVFNGESDVKAQDENIDEVIVPCCLSRPKTGKYKRLLINVREI